MRISCFVLLATVSLGMTGTTGAQSVGNVARTAAREYRRGHESEILNEFAGLLAIPNLATDSAGIRRNADSLLQMLGRRGFTNTKRLEVPGAAPAVYGELRSPGATRTLVLYAHYDGQPLDPRQWTTPPWSPVLRDKEVQAGGKVIALPGTTEHADPESRIYARSAGDDKATIMAILAAVDAMTVSHLTPSVNLKVFFEGEEEASSAHLGQILQTYSPLLAADAWIFGDGPMHQSGRQQVLFGNRGITSFELTLYGANRALHSGHYGNWAPNPGVLLANLVASMRDDDGHIKIAHYYDDMQPVSAAEHRAVAALPKFDPELRKALGLAHTEENDALLAERIMLPAFNLRGMRVGGVRETGSNTIATEAYASFDLRLVPGQVPARVQQLVEAHIRKQGYFVTHDTVTPAMRLAHAKVARLQWSDGYPASRAPMDGAFGKAVIAALSDGAAEPPLLIPTSGGTGPTYLFEQVLHAPVINLPIANYDDNQHAADENLRLKNLWDGIELYSALLAGIGRTWGGRVVP